MGAPAEVYNHPASPFVYGFLGNVNLFHGRVNEGVMAAAGASLPVPDHHQARDAGVREVIAKPDDVADMRESIARVLNADRRST